MASNKNTGQEFADLQSKAQQVLNNRSNELENQMIVHKESQEDAVDLQGALQMTVDPNSGQAVPTSGPQAVPASQAGLRPETQAILSRYGVNASVSERSSRSSSNSTTKNSTTNTSTQSTGGTKVTNTTTVNNVTNNNTTTTTNVKSEAQPQRVVVQSAAPTAVRANSQEIAAKQQVFLNNFFRKKSTADAQRDREYRKKDRELKREQNSLFDKLKDFTSRTINSLDPNNNSTQKGTMNFFKWIIGSYLVGKYLHPTLKLLDRAVTYFVGPKDKVTGERGGSLFVQDIKSIGNGFKDFFSGLMDQRRQALSMIPKPKSVTGEGPIDDAVGTMKNYLRYAVDALKVMVGGKAGLESVADSHVERAATSGMDENYESAKKEAKVAKKRATGEKFTSAVNLTNSALTDAQKEAINNPGSAIDRAQADRWINRDVSSIMKMNDDISELNKSLPTEVPATYLRSIGVDPKLLGAVGLTQYGTTPLTGQEFSAAYLAAKAKAIWEGSKGNISESGLKALFDQYQSYLKEAEKVLGSSARASDVVEDLSKSMTMVSASNAELSKVLLSAGSWEKLLKDKKLKDAVSIDKEKGNLLYSINTGGKTGVVDAMRSNLQMSGIDHSSMTDDQIFEKYRSKNKGESAINIYDALGYHDQVSGELSKLKSTGEIWDSTVGEAWRDSTPRKSASDLYHSAVQKLSESEVLNNAKKITSSLMSRLGFTPAQASGAVGVLMAESGLNPKAENLQEKAGETSNKRTADGVSHGQGIAQWSLERNRHFYNWYKKKYGEGKYPAQASLDDQIEFMIHEMMGRPVFMEAMRNAQDPAQAADVMLRGFENGSEKGLATPRQLDSYDEVGSGNYNHLITTRASYAHGIHDTLFGKESPVETKAEGGEVTQDISGSSGVPFSSVPANDVSYSSETGFNVPAIATPTVTSVSPSEIAKNFKPMVSEADSNKVDLDTLAEIKGLRKDLRTVGAAIVQASSSPIILNQGGTTVNNNITPSSGVDISNTL